jgi:hypothetical protein
MRNVKFRQWIPVQIEKNDKGTSVRVPETGCWEKGFSIPGLFHGWGLTSEQAGDSVASMSIALVEDKQGIIHEVFPHNIIFLD